mmetsp:Transcript_23662/g.31706  ORF Transcript_23662/g.31706 Transcript_23662/m.31706 type:complete len:128 (-) Transcript_23662:278-661(-)
MIQKKQYELSVRGHHYDEAAVTQTLSDIDKEKASDSSKQICTKETQAGLSRPTTTKSKMFRNESMRPLLSQPSLAEVRFTHSKKLNELLNSVESRSHNLVKMRTVEDQTPYSNASASPELHKVDPHV